MVGMTMKGNMRRFRSRAGVLASVALTWQIVALIFVPAASCCQAQTEATSSEMANCPMHHAMKDVECPLHAQATADRDCHCPRLGCSETDQGFMALLGPIGVLPPAASAFALHQIGDAVPMTASSSINLAPAPLAPPPRA
jgi:hypothetical protein